MARTDRQAQKPLTYRHARLKDIGGREIMKDWEFLVQREGSRHWQAAQDSLLELEAGSYRILAQSPYPNQEIEVRIVQEPTTTEGIATSHQLQVRRSNAQGLLMVLPYTELQPGGWEIRCSGDIMAELLGEPWQKLLKLKVMANHTETENSGDDLPASPDSQPQEGLGELQQILPDQIDAPLEVNENPLPVFSITLEEDTFIRVPGEKVNIAGQIRMDPTQIEAIPAQSQLTYQLKRTQTGETVFQGEYPLTNHELLAPFDHTIEILDEPPITFLLGEVTLTTAEGICLARQSFSICTDTSGSASPETDIPPRYFTYAAQSSIAPKPIIQTVEINHSILPPKLPKERRTPPKKPLELPPIGSRGASIRPKPEPAAAIVEQEQEKIQLIGSSTEQEPSQF